MGKWAMRALVPIVGSNEQQLEHIITHDLFGKVSLNVSKTFYTHHQQDLATDQSRANIKIL